MKITEQHWCFETNPHEGNILQLLERAGRTCYKSEEKNLLNEMEISKKFVKNIMNRNHESVLEHVSISVRITTDRGVSHELVRHRLASYSQESTRYCNYSHDKFDNEITVIYPVWFKPITFEEPEYEDKRFIQSRIWTRACQQSEKDYFEMLEAGATPQEARSVLNNSLKTEIFMTANLREWRHFFKLRTSKAAHPQMRDLAISMLNGFKIVLPVIFEDIEV